MNTSETSPMHEDAVEYIVAVAMSEWESRQTTKPFIAPATVDEYDEAIANLDANLEVVKRTARTIDTRTDEDYAEIARQRVHAKASERSTKRSEHEEKISHLMAVRDQSNMMLASNEAAAELHSMVIARITSEINTHDRVIKTYRVESEPMTGEICRKQDREAASNKYSDLKRLHDRLTAYWQQRTAYEASIRLLITLAAVR